MKIKNGELYILILFKNLQKLYKKNFPQIFKLSSISMAHGSSGQDIFAMFFFFFKHYFLISLLDEHLTVCLNDQ